MHGAPSSAGIEKLAELLSALRDADDGRGGIYLTGEAGMGKTALAAQLAAHAAEQGLRASGRLVGTRLPRARAAAEQAAGHAPITCVLYVGIGQLRRAWPRGLPGSEVDAYVDLATPTLLEAAGVPPRDADEAIKSAGRDQAKGGSDERA